MIAPTVHVIPSTHQSASQNEIMVENEATLSTIQSHDLAGHARIGSHVVGVVIVLIKLVIFQSKQRGTINIGVKRGREIERKREGDEKCQVQTNIITLHSFAQHRDYRCLHTMTRPTRELKCYR